ncbi:sensor histidine kinase [Longimicrobium terrae]|uniref:LytS/YehU family sensor histidine kinase n=1 Tax=Longimicrobium terrae TaxID=1639882 RepID=A0A841H7H8_9BACT|nr:histidine kinase [Longimicrobium terrae]MBB4639502.1 LytS/YehU family sensor histidine kinase [Longimicrobium terrae]MBB6073874.1 LytS/YehU family sensor histidine kinase [Longimicrobium terrae]NNC32508.1 histidine kinase [Longimicrobium terrae]
MAGPREPAILRPRTLAAFYLAFWAGAFCFSLFAYHFAGTFSHPTQSAVFDMGTWMVVSALGCSIGYMLPMEQGPTWRQAFALAAGALAVGFVRALLIELLASRYGWVTGGLLNLYLVGIGADLLINVSFVGMGSALSGAIRNHHEQVRMAALEDELAASRAAAMRAHLRPGIVLRAMESMADQLLSDPDGATGRVMSLSALLNLQLQRARQSRVSVDEELEFIHAYVEMDRAAAGSTIHLRVQAGDAALALPIPPNCISILLESVLRARPEAATDVVVEIEVRVVGERLEIVVRDDLAVGASARNAQGWEAVSDLSASLAAQFGPGAIPRFADRAEGVESRVSIPIGRLEERAGLREDADG